MRAEQHCTVQEPIIGDKTCVNHQRSERCRHRSHEADPEKEIVAKRSPLFFQAVAKQIEQHPANDRPQEVCAERDKGEGEDSPDFAFEDLAGDQGQIRKRITAAALAGTQGKCQE